MSLIEEYGQRKEEKGIQKGIQKGIKKGQEMIIKNMLKDIFSFVKRLSKSIS